MKKRIYPQAGFGLLEVVVAVAILGATLFSLSFVFAISEKLHSKSVNKTRANFVAEEGIEVMRFLRDKSWYQNLDSLVPGTPYYLPFTTGSPPRWGITTTNPGLIDGLFQRTVKVADVYRDGSDNIVTSGGSLDSDSLEVTVDVSWSERGETSSTTVKTYLMNAFQN